AVLQGSKLDFSLKANRLKSPTIAFSLGADKLDLDALFPPVLDVKPAGESGKSAAGPEDGGEKAEAPAPRPVTHLNWAFLDNLDVTGDIKSDEFKFQNLSASDFKV